MVTELQPAPGMVYQQCPLQPGGRRIIVTRTLPRRGSVQVTDPDGTHRHWLKATNLHATSVTPEGRPRRKGYAYVRESCSSCSGDAVRPCYADHTEPTDG